MTIPYPKQKRFGFTLLELLVSISIMILLASLLLPSLQKAKESGRKILCKSNLKQLGTYFQLYAGDNNDFLPFSDSTAYYSTSYGMNPNLLPQKAYVGYDYNFADLGNSIYKCPSVHPRSSVYWRTSYGYNWYPSYYPQIGKLNLYKHPSQTMLLMERGWDDALYADGSLTGYPWYSAAAATPSAQMGYQLGRRHGNAGNLTYLDGHVSETRTPPPATRDDVFFDYSHL